MEQIFIDIIEETGISLKKIEITPETNGSTFFIEKECAIKIDNKSDYAKTIKVGSREVVIDSNSYFFLRISDFITSDEFKILINMNKFDSLLRFRVVDPDILESNQILLLRNFEQLQVEKEFQDVKIRDISNNKYLNSLEKISDFINQENTNINKLMFNLSLIKSDLSFTQIRKSIYYYEIDEGDYNAHPENYTKISDKVYIKLENSYDNFENKILFILLKEIKNSINSLTKEFQFFEEKMKSDEEFMGKEENKVATIYKARFIKYLAQLKTRIQEEKWLFARFLENIEDILRVFEPVITNNFESKSAGAFVRNKKYFYFYNLLKKSGLLEIRQENLPTILLINFEEIKPKELIDLYIGIEMFFKFKTLGYISNFENLELISPKIFSALVHFYNDEKEVKISSGKFIKLNENDRKPSFMIEYQKKYHDEFELGFIDSHLYKISDLETENSYTNFSFNGEFFNFYEDTLDFKFKGKKVSKYIYITLDHERTFQNDGVYGFKNIDKYLLEIGSCLKMLFREIEK